LGGGEGGDDGSGDDGGSSSIGGLVTVSPGKWRGNDFDGGVC
jgi:hypothetical protein